MAEFDPKNYGSKKSKVYSAAPSAGTATVKKDTAASAAVSDYTGGGETFSPNRYGSKKSKLYSADVKTPQTTQKKESPSFSGQQNLNTGRFASDLWSTAFLGRTLFISIFVEKEFDF